MRELSAFLLYMMNELRYVYLELDHIFQNGIKRNGSITMVKDSTETPTQYGEVFCLFPFTPL